MIVIHFDVSDKNFHINDINEVFKSLKEKCPEETFIALPSYMNLRKDIDLEYLIQYRDILNTIIKKITESEESNADKSL